MLGKPGLMLGKPELIVGKPRGATDGATTAAVAGWWGGCRAARPKLALKHRREV